MALKTRTIESGNGGKRTCLVEADESSTLNWLRNILNNTISWTKWLEMGYSVGERAEHTNANSRGATGRL